MKHNDKRMARHDFPYESHYVEILDSRIHYVDTGGSGSPVVMIHGLPTWSYLWRNVIPHLEGKHRVVALDLIGFGKSDKPDIEYLSTDHAKYLQGFMEALQLGNTTLVLHDWGGLLGFDYAAKYPARVKAIAFMETLIPAPPAEAPYGPPKPIISTEEQSVEKSIGGLRGYLDVLKKIKTPGVGEEMILENNLFLEQLVIPSLANVLTEDELNAYREPFKIAKDRKSMLQLHRDSPLDGKNPDYSVEMVERYMTYLRTQKDLPKLLLHLSEGFLIDRWNVEWIRNNIPNTQVHDMGPGGHFMPEYNPDGIGQAVALWMDKNQL